VHLGFSLDGSKKPPADLGKTPNMRWY